MPNEKIIHLWGHLLGAKNYSSVRYAFYWCKQLASWDSTMGSDTDMQTLYHEYAARARHLGHVTEKFELPGDIIRPVHFDTWYEIFCRVYDSHGGDYFVPRDL